jgi:hypothetical protein
MATECNLIPEHQLLASVSRMRFRRTVTDASVRAVWRLARVPQPRGQIRTASASMSKRQETPHGDSTNSAAASTRAPPNRMLIVFRNVLDWSRPGSQNLEPNPTLLTNLTAGI